MDNNRVEGKMKDIKGRVKRQVGEWTDDTKLQSEGTIDQAEGKGQAAFGKVKDTVRDIADKAKGEVHKAEDRLDEKTKRSA